MATVVFGNHSSVLVPRQDRENIRKFYGEVLGGTITRSDPDRDFVRVGGDFYIAFLYGDVADESAFHRTARAMWLEIKSDDVAAIRGAILACGLARQLEIPDPHLYFQAPGGQCLRLVGLDEKLSFYEGAADGPNVGQIKEALGSMNDHAGAGVQVHSMVKASIHEVWQAFTTSAGAQSFFAPKARIDLALGGPYEIYFNPANEAQSTKGKRVLSYEPETMLSFEWSAPPEVPAVNHANTWVVVRLMSNGPGETEVNISHLGYGSGPEWDKARKHFEQGWAELLERLQQRFAVGPVNWASQPMMWKKPEAGEGAVG